MRTSNRQKFKGSNRETIHAGNYEENKASFKEFPESQVKAVIKQIREKAKNRRQKELFFVIMLSIVAFALIIYLLSPPDKVTPVIEINSIPLEEKPIDWSGKSSEPLKIPNTDFFYIPVVSGMERELKSQGGIYRIYPPNMVGNSTSNVIFFDKDTLEIGKLLARNGLVSSMFLGPMPNDIGPKNIVYEIAEEDSNRNGIINRYDHHTLNISDLNGSNLIKITDRDIRSIQWVNQGQEILIEFYKTKDMNDSIYGFYNIETNELKLTNQPDQGS